MIKSKLIELINALRRPGEQKLAKADLIADPDLVAECDVEIARLRASSVDPLTPTDRKCYYAVCMIHDPRGPSMIELILDEHPLVWAEGKKKELRDASVRAAVMIQFFNEIPREVYDLMKQPKSVLVEPTAQEKSRIIGGK